MFRMLMSVAKIKISEINRQGEQCAQHPDRIMPVKREINQQQYRADCAAFPETNRNNALAGPFRCDPLDNEAGTENEVAAPAKNFPAIDRNSSDRSIGNQMKTVHGATLAENACPRESFPANIFV
jgi:hypothetical protein